MEQQPVVCVVGPTASGKTKLAITLAKELDGEIINMDSMQIYRRMDIGTAKPSLAERQGIKHHLLDILEPHESFTVAQYAKAAQDTIREVGTRGKLPILTGGTGFYLRALTQALQLGGIRSDDDLRRRLKREAETPEGKLRLFSRLEQIDPKTAARLHPNDVQRVTRAIEVYELTGKPFSHQQPAPQTHTMSFCMLGTTMDRAMLYTRINARVERMMEQGLLREVQALLHNNVPATAQAMQGIGYKEIVAALAGETSIQEAVQRIQQHTRHYAKRQWTWFRAEPRVQWLDMEREENTAMALQMAKTFWKEANQ